MSEEELRVLNNAVNSLKFFNERKKQSDAGYFYEANIVIFAKMIGDKVPATNLFAWYRQNAADLKQYNDELAMSEPSFVIERKIREGDNGRKIYLCIR